MRIAFLPIPPMLIPQIAAGAAGELDTVREAAVRAVDWVCEGNSIGIVTPAEPVNAADWSLTGFGVTVGDGTPVGLAEGVARWLLDGRPARAVSATSDLRGFDALLVMGDASASRTEKAPGHINEAAIPFDDHVLALLSDGDAAGLAALDLQVAARVGAVGAPAWAEVARQIDTVEEATVDLVADPFGVLYVVARWVVAWADPA